MADGSEIAELLKRLTTVDNLAPAGAEFKGIAVSKGEGTLHLAVGDGVIEIPVGSITNVVALGGHPNAVSVTVNDPAGVRSIYQAARTGGPIGGTHPGALSWSTITAGNAADTPVNTIDDLDPIVLRW
jgi:hypothetical protein